MKKLKKLQFKKVASLTPEELSKVHGGTDVMNISMDDGLGGGGSWNMTMSWWGDCSTCTSTCKGTTCGQTCANTTC